jgi:hypothetical protein
MGARPLQLTTRSTGQEPLQLTTRSTSRELVKATSLEVRVRGLFSQLRVVLVGTSKCNITGSIGARPAYSSAALAEPPSRGSRQQR